jgi:hypothetical protein
MGKVKLLGSEFNLFSNWSIKVSSLFEEFFEILTGE